MRNMTNKQSCQLRKNYDDLLINTAEARIELDSLRHECNDLRSRLTSSDDENRMLKEQLAANLSVLMTLKSQNLELNEEITQLESSKAMITGEVEELKREIVKLEELRKEEKAMADKLKEEKERCEVEYNSLQRRYNAVMATANDRDDEVRVRDRLSKLEKEVEILKQNSSASSGLFAWKTQPESDTRHAQEKPATPPTRTVPYIPEPPLSSLPIVDLDSSDDDDAEMPSPADPVRKLQTTSKSDNMEKDDNNLTGYCALLEQCMLSVRKKQGQGEANTTMDPAKHPAKDVVNKSVGSVKSVTKPGTDKRNVKKESKSISKGKRKRSINNTGYKYGDELVGSKVEVLWPNDKRFYDGIIEQFDPSTGKHKVTYNDGDVEDLRLEEEKWRLVDGSLGHSSCDNTAQMLNTDKAKVVPVVGAMKGKTEPLAQRGVQSFKGGFQSRSNIKKLFGKAKNGTSKSFRNLEGKKVEKPMLNV